jgi:DNA repair exonuclease SbcCD nuclease subunit
MKIFITADLHAHAWQPWSIQNPDGCNSRLAHAVGFLKTLGRLAKGETILFLGDLFDNRQNLPVEVLYHISSTIEQIVRDGTDVILLAGNHDQHLKNGSITSLNTFGIGSAVTVVTEPTIVSPTRGLGGVSLHLHPYSEDLAAVRAWIDQNPPEAGRKTLLGLHHVILGSKMNGGSLAEFGLTHSDLKRHPFNQVWSGHHHAPQPYYVGSPMQLDRGEKGDRKRLLVWDTVLDRVESVDVDNHIELPGFYDFQSAVEACAWARGENRHGYLSIFTHNPDAEDKMAMEGLFLWMSCAPSSRQVKFVPVPKAIDLEAAERISQQAMGEGFVDLKASIPMWLERVGRLDLVQRALDRYAGVA